MEWWIKVIIGVIVAGAWIAGNIKEKQKAAEKAAPPPLPPVDPDASAAAVKADDLQDFLKQLRSRMGDSDPQRINEPVPAVLVEEAPRIESPPVLPTRKSKKRRPPAVASDPPRRSSEIALPDSMKFSSASTSELVPLTGVKAPSPAVRDAVRLLKSPMGMKTAFILREILSEPLAKRRRSR